MPTLVVPEVVISCAGVTLPRDMWYQPVVVVAYEGGDSLLQVRRSLVGDLVEVPLDGLVIALQLAIGLRVKGGGQYVPDAHHLQVVPEGPGDAVHLTVTDDGDPVRPRAHVGSGYGIIGMTERVSLLGGQLRAGRGPTGRWVVDALNTQEHRIRRGNPGTDW